MGKTRGKGDMKQNIVSKIIANIFGASSMKEFGIDLIFDVLGGLCMAIGLYNFAVHAKFPLTGFSGISLILFNLFGLPLGITQLVLNIPVALFTFRLLGRNFFFRSIKTMVILSFLTDVIAPMFPTYEGDRMLAAICTGIFSGIGCALIYMRNSSTGGSDFIMMAIKKLRPHLSLGKISFSVEMIIILIGFATVFRNIDSLIYGIMINYLLSMVVDKVLYGIDAGKVAFIVTERGPEIMQLIDETLGRGSTIMKGHGSTTPNEKAIVMCACNNKEMFTIRKLISSFDTDSFVVIMESNEVMGEGFKEFLE